MLLNRCKFINALASIEINDSNKKRSWDTFYKNNTCNYWNNLIWKKILESDFINGTEIDKYEFFDFCGYYCNKEKSEALFNRINQRSRSINFLEFEDFLEIIDFKDYNKIMNSLENNEKLKNIDESSEELKKDSEEEIINTQNQNQLQNTITNEATLFDLELEKIYNKQNFTKIIINGVFSPHDSRDWLYDNYLNQTNYSLPIILDYRTNLLPVRNQGNQGSCFAMSVACMKEYQEKQDYGLNEYLSPQFFYNIRGNLYDNNKQNEEGMYGRNVMKLLMKYGICSENLYSYGRIQYKDKIPESCFKEAENHKIKGYGRVLSIEALKYSLKYNGLCLIVFPIYNYGPEMWIKNENDKFLGGHAMTIVGYLEKCFIIRNSWGPDWGDNGYSYYFFSDWGAHWEIWTTIDISGSKKLKFASPQPSPLVNPNRPSTPIPIPIPIVNTNKFLDLKDVILRDSDEPYIKPPSTPSSEKEEQSERDKDLDDLELDLDLEILEESENSEDSNYNLQPSPKPINHILKIFEELFKNLKNLFF
jgi:hypothetical protein